MPRTPSPVGGGAAHWTDRASELIASVFVDAGGDVNVALVQEVAGGVQRTVEAAITDLPSAQQQKLRERLGRHLICGLLAMAVQALEPFAEADEQIAEALTQPTHSDQFGLSEKIINQLLKGMIAKFIQALGHTALAKAKAALKLLRMSAIAICPDPERHSAVRRLCLVPLAGEAGNTAAVAELARLQLPPANESH